MQKHKQQYNFVGQLLRVANSQNLTREYSMKQFTYGYMLRVILFLVAWRLKTHKLPYPLLPNHMVFVLNTHDCKGLFQVSLKPKHFRQCLLQKNLSQKELALVENSVNVICQGLLKGCLFMCLFKAMRNYLVEPIRCDETCLLQGRGGRHVWQ